MTDNHNNNNNQHPATHIDFSDFDPQSPQYQLHAEYPPNKSKTWKMKVQDDGWTLMHNCLRIEIQRLHQILSSLIVSHHPTLEAWQVDSLKYIFHIHFQTVHGHHTNEDEILTPVLKQRFVYPTKMEDDHSVIIQHIHTLENHLQNLTVANATLGIQNIWHAFESYEKSLLPHLLEEEQVGLLLMRAYFTQEEIRPVIAKILAKSLKNEPFLIGMTIHYLGEEYVRKTMMKGEGIPCFVWHLVFKRQMKKFQRHVGVYYVALETQVAPSKKQQKRIAKQRY